MLSALSVISKLAKNCLASVHIRKTLKKEKAMRAMCQRSGVDRIHEKEEEETFSSKPCMLPSLAVPHRRGMYMQI